MVLDQFLSSLTPELRLFKERRTTNLKEAIQQADDWASAHNSYFKAFSSNHPKKLFPHYTTSHKSQASPTYRPTSSTVKCDNCGEEGNIRPRCPKNPRGFKDQASATPQYKVGFCLGDRCVPSFSVTGTINGSWSSSIIRDTRCSGSVVPEEVLPDVDLSLCPKVQMSDYLGHVDEFPVVRCYFRCPFYTGWTYAVREPIKFGSALVGNIPGVRDLNDPDPLQSDKHQTTVNILSQRDPSSGCSSPVADTEGPPVVLAVSSTNPPSTSTQVFVVQTRKVG